MTTVVAPCDAKSIEQAARLIHAGALVAFPTETVYGLGANGLNNEAVLRIFEAKGRPADNPLILHVTALHQILPLVSGPLPDAARILADAFWPGPMTMVLPKSTLVPDAVSAGLSTVAVRVPSHPAARALINAAGVPIAAKPDDSEACP
jgi:L-threonylcarbamoyladenylate synthase